MSEDLELVAASRLRAWQVVAEAESITRQAAGVKGFDIPLAIGRLIAGSLVWYLEAMEENGRQMVEANITPSLP